MQKLVYKGVISTMHVNCIHVTLQRRLESLFDPFILDFSNTIILQSLSGGLKKHRVAEVMKVLKVWATSRRYHEDIQLPCLFGCQHQSDDLHHYLQCPHLFALWSFISPGVDSDPLVRWALIKPVQGVNPSDSMCSYRIPCYQKAFQKLRN